MSQVDFIRREDCPLGLERRDCRACWVKLASVDASANAPALDIMQCSKCDLGVTDPSPSPETLGLLYVDNTAADTNFEPIGNTIIDRLKDWAARRDLKRIIGGGTPPRRILDYGTGNGRFALVARRVLPDCEVDALDFADQPPPALRAPIDGIKYLTTRDLGGQTYDLIMLRHVLEHHPKPIALLESLKSVLSDRGVLYVEVPNLRSWFVQGAGRWTNTWSVPFHLVHFTEKSLRTAIETAGLKAEIEEVDMPLAGTTLAMLLDQPKQLGFQLLGVALHPAQMLLAKVLGKACLGAICRKA